MFVCPCTFLWCADVPRMLLDRDGGSTSSERQFGWPGVRRRFHCGATGLPLPTITWSRSGGLFVVDSDTYRVNTTTRRLTVASTLEVAASSRLFARIFFVSSLPWSGESRSFESGGVLQCISPVVLCRKCDSVKLHLRANRQSDRDTPVLSISPLCLSVASIL